MTMRCPKCAADAPPFSTREGVTMNFCSGCKGLWFDAGELAFYCETESDLLTLARSLPKAKVTAFTCTRCPAPGTKLLELPYHDGEALLVDWCPTCKGAFLDARELANVERLAARHEHVSSRLRRAVERLEQAGYVSLSGGKPK